MSSQKPKISFNAGPSPRPAPVVQQVEEEFVVQAEAVTETSQSVTYDGFDREEWERQLTAPEPTVEPVPDPEIAPRPYEPFTPTPKSAGFSPIGFFKKSQPRFFDRRAARRSMVCAITRFRRATVSPISHFSFTDGPLRSSAFLRLIWTSYNRPTRSKQASCCTYHAEK